MSHRKKMIGGGHSPHVEEGEAWLISYADMMTLLFGFFVIMFSLADISESKMSAVGAQIAESFKGKKDKKEVDTGILMEARQIRALQMLVALLNLGDNVEKTIETVEKIVAGSKDIEAAKKVIMKELKGKDKVMEELRMNVSETTDSVELSLPSTMLFESGGAELTFKAKMGLKKVVGYLNKIQGLAGVEIVGHTDSLPPSISSKYPGNFALSAARAGAVAEEFLKQGLSAKGVVTRGMANLQPLFPERRANRTLISENLSKNRRVSILIKKKHVNEPGT